MSDINWYCYFIIGSLLTFSGAVFFMASRKTKRNAAISTMIEFVAYGLMLYPTILADAADSRYMGIESGFMTFLNTLARFRGDGYDHLAYGEQLSPEFFSVYNIIMIAANILMIAFAASFVVQLFDNLSQSFRLIWHRYNKVMVFSECNEKTVSIAESIDEYAKSDEDFGKYNIVFSNKEENRYSHRLEKLRAIVVNKDVDSVVKLIEGKSKSIEVFLFNGEEESNLRQLNALCDDTGFISETRIYAEVNKTHWRLYDKFIKEVTYGNAKLTINLVRTEETFAYDNLFRNSIFDNYAEKKVMINELHVVKNADGTNSFRTEEKQVVKKVIKLLFAGINDRSVEMFKAVLHLSQMPGYFPVFIVLDEEDRPDHLKSIIPDLTDGCTKEGDSLYEFIYRGGIQADSSALLDMIANEYSDFTFAFVDYGDDLKNSNAAISINALCHKHNRFGDYKLQVSISDSSVYKKWNDYLLRDISIVGQNDSVYSYRSITMSGFDKLSQKIHEVRQNEKMESARKKAEAKGEKFNYKKDPWKDYYNNEYNRHSVYARTLSFRYKVRFIKASGEDPLEAAHAFEPWLIYEHMRWNMYTRTFGYTCPAGEINKTLLDMTNRYEETREKKIRDEREKLRSETQTHEDLVSFEYLHPNVQNYDGLRLTPDIVKAFDEFN